MKCSDNFVYSSAECKEYSLDRIFKQDCVKFLDGCLLDVTTLLFE